MATRFIDHLLTGTHASRPAASAVPQGTLYACTDHDLIYQSDSSSWSTWADLTGGGSGAPTTGQYIVGALDGGLSNEKVRADLYKNYSADNYPPAASLADEFDDSSLDGAWSWTTAPTGTVSESEYPGFLYIDAHTSATLRYLKRAYSPGASTAFTAVIKLVPSMEDENATYEAGIAALDSGDALICRCNVLSDGTATGAKARRFNLTGTTTASMQTSLSTPVYLLLHRDAANTYTGYWSPDGIVWTFIATASSATAVERIAISFNGASGSGPKALVDFVRVWTAPSATQFKIGA